MHNLPKDIRELLKNKFKILSLKLESEYRSLDGTIKFLFKLDDDNFIESVYLKDINNRITFCISSQVGCRMGCLFCKTGEMGFKRDLTISEIVSQVLYMFSIMKLDSSVVDSSFNIVFMGMGEPLDNFDNVEEAIKIFIDKEKFALSQNRITISTCGLIDKIIPMIEKFPNINIALSLITANQEKREKIMPISKRFSLDDIATLLNEYYSLNNNRITLEYVMIKDFNIGRDDIELLKKFKNERFHINLIPLNFESEFCKIPSENEIKYFYKALLKKGFIVTIRHKRGQDIDGACGMLSSSKI
jgi:23S rRNA (adenine2503-C2)-methyltransferase